MVEKKFTFENGTYEVTLGKFANQANGACWLRQGGTIVLSTVVSAPTEEFPGFLPLTVDFREIYAAAGKIPGGYFKREGKFTDREVLTGRLIDRTIRPLFPEYYFNSVQILTTVYSVDKEHMPYGLGLLATSIALMTSDLPFMGPVGYAEIGRINGEWIINPTLSQSGNSDVKLFVAGTAEGICMVEGSASELSEQEFLDALFIAHDSLKKQIAWQEEILRDMPPVKKQSNISHFDPTLWKQKSKDFLSHERVLPLFKSDKVERSELREKLEEEFVQAHEAEIVSQGISKEFVLYIFDEVLRELLTRLSFEKNQRFDLRGFDTVRPIGGEVGLLPYNHGSALFNRGRTQALVSVTLTGGQDDLRFETLMEETPEKTVPFLLHYNFPPFSVGEVRPMRGPGRREVGHGHLAASAIQRVLPDREKFPYLLRIVADMLESDGSTSMATICGSTLALMDAGVPIQTMVSGVAMGLLKDPASDRFTVLTDIAGFEDAFGLMDFKVAGTNKGIVAIQMDIKYKGGLKREVFELALEKARQGRLHILAEMQKIIHAPRTKLSDLVPKVISFKIPRDKIGAVIGTGGKVIREIIEKTATTIDIEDDGTVKIFGQPGPKLDEAVDWVKLLGGYIELGARYEGTIKRVADFGCIVEIVPGVDGLVHISTIPRRDQEQRMRSFKIGDTVSVEIVEYDSDTGRIRLKFVEPKEPKR